MKKLIALLLAILTLVAAIACAETEAPEGSDTTATVTEAETDDGIAHTNLPSDLNYEGRTFTLLSSNYNQYHTSTVEEMNGDVLNDAIYNMEFAVEGLLNIEIKEDNVDVGQLNKAVSGYVLAGDGTYDAVSQLDRFSVQNMLDGLLYPLEQAEYIDLDAVYWNPMMADILSLGGKTYYAVSSYNFLTLVYTSCYYFNTVMAADFNLPASQLYDDVYKGTWTLDTMKQYITLATSDLDGDGKMGPEDRYGMTSFDWNVFGTSTLAGCGEYTVQKDENDIPYLSWETQGFIDIMEDVNALFNDVNVLSKVTRFNADAFINSRAMFMTGYFFAFANLSEMDDDYGVVPPPKRNESQDAYYAETYDAMYATIPLSATDLSFSGAVLEALSCEGYNNVIDAYVEVTLKYKKSRDEETINMIGKCVDARVIDIGVNYLYDFAGYDVLYTRVVSAKSFNLASYIASVAEKAEARLDDIRSVMTGAQS
ncbi:MAG: hypothetical protein ACYCWE_06205 [Eubacteriales bacterium]